MNENLEQRECRCCDGIMKETTTRFVAIKNDVVYVIQDVPSIKCLECGEIAYSAEVVTKLEALTSGRNLPQRVVNAWVYKWDNPVIEISKAQVPPSTTENIEFPHTSGTEVVTLAQ